jgi:hypothetical protein
VTVRILGAVVGAVASVAMLASCGPKQVATSSSTVVSAPAVSWDGTYHGTVRTTALGSGMTSTWCETEPEMVVQVKNNSFAYAMPHPNAPDNRTPVYSASIAPDGTFKGTIGSGEMRGRVVGSNMSGTVNGSLCVYAFSIDRS